MKSPAFDYARPTTLTEAVSLLTSCEGEAKLLAGGQSLVPMLAFRLAAPTLLVDLNRLSELGYIRIQDDGVRLGAMVRWRQIEDDVRLVRAHPLLVTALKHVAHYQVRNRGTIGGSLAHADPAAELPGIVVTCEAEITAIGAAGQRMIRAADFFLGPLTTALKPEEVIVELHLPPWPAQRRWGFEEFSRRRGDFALAAAALYYDTLPDGRACNSHVGVMGVGDRPQRLAQVEAMLNGRLIDRDTIAQAERAAVAAVNPADDIHASAAYRRALLGTMVGRALKHAAT
jgi:aerobic carbon-monoxide dehydrogenase medium subunit